MFFIILTDIIIGILGKQLKENEFDRKRAAHYDLTKEFHEGERQHDPFRVG